MTKRALFAEKSTSVIPSTIYTVTGASSIHCCWRTDEPPTEQCFFAQCPSTSLPAVRRWPSAARKPPSSQQQPPSQPPPHPHPQLRHLSSATNAAMQPCSSAPSGPTHLPNSSLCPTAAPSRSAPPALSPSTSPPVTPATLPSGTLLARVSPTSNRMKPVVWLHSGASLVAAGTRSRRRMKKGKKTRTRRMQTRKRRTTC